MRPSDSTRRWAADVRHVRDSLDPVSAAALLLIYEQHASPEQLRIQLGLEENQIKSTVASALQQFAAALFPAAGLRRTSDDR